MAAKKLQVQIDSPAALMLGARCRKTARIALKLLKRARDLAQVEKQAVITTAVVEEALNVLEVDEMGLDGSDRKILITLIEKYGGGPVGLNTLAASIAEDVTTIEDVYEPFLMQLGMLKRTSRGREATLKAFKHLGIKHG